MLLRRYRVGSGLTQNALARRAGLAVRGIQDLESGRHRPRRDSVRLLSIALALSSADSIAFEQAASPAPRRKARRVAIGLVPPAGSPPPWNLFDHVPRPPTRFVGREPELDPLAPFSKS